MSKKSSRKRGLGSVFVLILVGLALFATPNFFEIGGIGKTVFILVGVFVLLLAVVAFVIVKFTLKPEAEEAFVRTGLGGQHVIMDSWGWYFPSLQNKQDVDLKTRKLQVTKQERDALITKDKLRADMIVEFYVKVPKIPGNIIDAATSLGDKVNNDEELVKLIFQKFESAIRNVAFDKDLEELQRDRKEVEISIQDAVKDSLKKNGFELEDVTISKLDQTNPEFMDPNNVFDAQGMKRIAEITSKEKVLTNEFNKSAEEEIKKKDVSTKKKVILLETEQEEAEADKIEKVEKAKAKAEAQAAKFREDQQKEAEKARILKEQAIEEETVSKEIAVLKKQEEKAASDAKKAKAEALAVKEQESVATVREVEIAERNKRKSVIEEESEAAQQKIKENMRVDVQAYETTEIARANKEASANKAEARVKEAEAEKDSLIHKANGERALQMVPVEVKKAEVEVTAKDLEVRARYQEVSVKLQVEMKSLEVQEAIGVAQANAFAEAMKEADFTFWGSSGDVDLIRKSFMGGQQKQYFLEGFKKIGEGSEAADNYAKAFVQSMYAQGLDENTPDDVKEVVKNFAKSATSGLGVNALLKAVTGKEVSEDAASEIGDMAKAFLEEVSELTKPAKETPVKKAKEELKVKVIPGKEEEAQIVDTAGKEEVKVEKTASEDEGKGPKDERTSSEEITQQSAGESEDKEKEAKKEKKSPKKDKSGGMPEDEA